jgi:hypothetical protein
MPFARLFVTFSEQHGPSRPSDLLDLGAIRTSDPCSNERDHLLRIEVDVSPVTISIVSAFAAVFASIIGPVVTLVVAKRQFGANVLSTNRQKWIENFRDCLAEFIALMTRAALLKAESRPKPASSNESAVSGPAIGDIAERLMLSYAQLSLLAKDDDSTHHQLLQLARQALQSLHSEDTAVHDLERDIIGLTTIGRAIIRSEWARVKQGS